MSGGIRVNILVVDDEMIQVETISRGLRSRGYGVTRAHNGDEALEKIPTSMVTTDVLADFIIRHTPIAPEIDGRITQTGSQ